jgi:anti-sigma B factor antagonist
MSMSMAWSAERGYIVATLTGALDITCAAGLREQLLDLVRPAACRLVIDLSAVSRADARGLAVLVGAARRARLLGGLIRLTSPSPAVAEALGATGLGRQFDILTARS